MTNLPKLFLLVDDDNLCNLLTKMAIQKSLTGAEVRDFIAPDAALKFIETEFENEPEEDNKVLFLDINMPKLSGWEFLDIFETFPMQVKNQFKIYMLSSTIDPADIQRAKLNPHIIDFIEKPISKDFLVGAFSDK